MRCLLKCWAASASYTASTNSATVLGFRFPTAWKCVLGRAQRNQSMSTRSATWAAVGSPSSYQCRARRDNQQLELELGGGVYTPSHGSTGPHRLKKAPAGPGFPSSARRTCRRLRTAGRSRLAEPRRLGGAPTITPSRHSPSPPGSLCSQTFGEELQHRHQLSS